MHIFVIVEAGEKIRDLFARGFAEFGEIFGEETDFGGNDRPAGGFEGFRSGIQVFDLGQEPISVTSRTDVTSNLSGSPNFALRNSISLLHLTAWQREAALDCPTGC